MTALWRLVACCDEEGALELISDEQEWSLLVEPSSGYTALHYACEYGLALLADRLVALGASVERETSKDLSLNGRVVQSGGQRPLHLAATAGELQIVQSLIAAGADVTATDWDEIPVGFERLVSGNKDEIATALLSAGATHPAASLREAAKGHRTRRFDLEMSIPDHLREPYTIAGLWTTAECAAVLGAVVTDGGWSDGRHRGFSTNDLPCENIVPEMDQWCRESLKKNLFPRLAERHGWRAEEMAFRDLFFVRYSAAPGRQRDLAVHRDGSIVSFNILLNDPSDFDGGGTYLEAENRVYRIGRGDCFVHAGKHRHGAAPVTRGERFVLVAFLDVVK